MLILKPILKSKKHGKSNKSKSKIREHGTFYLAEKNPRTHPEKLSLKKYDKKSKKHEEFVEKKLK